MKYWVGAGAVFGAWLLGAFYGLLVALAPDHLGTIITLTVASDDVSAFRVGAVWGLSHAAGMGMIIGNLFFIEFFFGLSLQGWETCSDYAVGASMVFCAMYFAAREAHYIKEHDDGTQALVACDCRPRPSERRRRPRKAKPLCVAFERGKCCDPESLSGELSSLTDELEPVWGPWLPASSRDINGAVMGAIQGMCCPMSFVGTTFAGFLSTPARCAAFGAAFLVWSMVGTGVLALLWSRLTRHGGAWLPPAALYRGSCAITLLLGTAWIAASAAGRLDSLEWTMQLLRKPGAAQDVGAQASKLAGMHHFAGSG